MAHPTDGVNERIDDESVLAARARQGDEEAFAVLVRRHSAIAHRSAYVICRNRADADDALQEGTMKAWSAICRFDPQRPFRAWFTTIVANTARNRARAWVRREALTLRMGADLPPVDPAEHVVSRAEGAALIRHLDALPKRYREAVALRHLVGLSEQETADALGVRPGTIKSRVARGLAALRQAMGEGWT